MILAKTLKEMLERVPDGAQIYAYEGESVGIGINMPDGSFEWIEARSSNTEDEQTEFDL